MKPFAGTVLSSIQSSWVIWYPAFYKAVVQPMSAFSIFFKLCFSYWHVLVQGVVKLRHSSYCSADTDWWSVPQLAQAVQPYRYQVCSQTSSRRIQGCHPHCRTKYSVVSALSRNVSESFGSSFSFAFLYIFNSFVECLVGRVFVLWLFDFLWWCHCKQVYWYYI